MAKEVQVRKDNSNFSTMDRFSDFDRLVESFFGNRFGSTLNEWPTSLRKPLSQVKETDDAYILSAEVPGIPMKDIDIQINGNVLTIHAEQKTEDTNENHFRRESRSYHQSFSLPTTVDSDKVEAHCENGVLEILLPKIEMAKPKKVEIQTGKGSLLNRFFGKSPEPNQKPKH